MRAGPSTLLVALGITVAAVAGKVVAGVVAGDAHKLTVGLGMIPRGEVGLIFATMGRSLGVVGPELFSALVLAIVLTTLVTPPLLAALLRHRDEVVAPGALAFKRA
ncbi:MAG: cation:proton antiporter [bacterium]|nr:cation:proton antiporter [bacterium]MDZ4296326.1 cation:proton antiporter [Patescibacteria group bacterium]